MPDYSQYRIIVDTPASSAGLGFTNIASALAHAIDSSRPRFAVGIFGPWGSGKTTLMNAVSAALPEARTVCVEFSAWRYEREDHLLVPLLDSIRAALVTWADQQPAAAPGIGSNVRDAVLTTASTVGKVITALVAGMSLKVGLPNALEFSFEANDALAKAEQLGLQRPVRDDLRSRVERLASPDFPQSIYHAGYEQLKRTFTTLRETMRRDADTDLRFVVFVDDLDRCLPQGALEVLEAIKLFFELEGFVFVVGLDRAIVERFIEQRYAGVPAAAVEASSAQPFRAAAPLVSGAEYIKKIFQVPFNLAPVQLSQLDDLIEAITQDGQLPAEQVDELRSRVQRHLRVLLADVAVNPREVKRYINSFVMQMKITPHLQPDVVLAIQTLKARLDWKAVDDALATYRDEYLVALRSLLVDNEANALTDLDAELTAVPQSFQSYVAEDGAARELLEPFVAMQITEYLYSVESTSAQGPSLVDALRLLSRARRSAQAASTFDAGTVFTQVQEMLRNARSMMSGLESFPALRALVTQIERIESVDAMPPPTNTLDADADLKKAVERLTAAIGTVIARTRSLRRQGFEGG